MRGSGFGLRSCWGVCGKLHPMLVSEVCGLDWVDAGAHIDLRYMYLNAIDLLW